MHAPLGETHARQDQATRHVACQQYGPSVLARVQFRLGVEGGRETNDCQKERPPDLRTENQEACQFRGRCVKDQNQVVNVPRAQKGCQSDENLGDRQADYDSLCGASERVVENRVNICGEKLQKKTGMGVIHKICDEVQEYKIREDIALRRGAGFKKIQ